MSLGVLLKAHYITSLEVDRNPAQHSIIKGLRLKSLANHTMCTLINFIYSCLITINIVCLIAPEEPCSLSYLNNVLRSWMCLD